MVFVARVSEMVQQGRHLCPLDIYIPKPSPNSSSAFPELWESGAVLSCSFYCDGSSISPLSTEFLSNEITCVSLHLKCLPWDANEFCSPLYAADEIPEDEGGQRRTGNMSGNHLHSVQSTSVLLLVFFRINKIGF